MNGLLRGSPGFFAVLAFLPSPFLTEPASVAGALPHRAHLARTLAGGPLRPSGDRGLAAGTRDGDVVADRIDVGVLGVHVGVDVVVHVVDWGAGTIALVAHRMPFVGLLLVVTVQCPRSSIIRLQQGRQDLNLQPAVLETAALPVELRPFAERHCWQILAVQGLTQLTRSPIGRSETDGQRA